MTDLVSRKLRAPQEDGAALIDPPLSQVAAIVESNRAKLAEFDRVAGLPAQFRTLARLFLAVNASLPDSMLNAGFLQRPVILAGHQPTLFHPGVWLKVFVLSSVAKAVRGTGINLIIDNDVVRTASIQVPSASDSVLSVTDLPFDDPAAELPWEMRTIQNLTTFEQFPSRLRAKLDSLGDRSSNLVIDRLWPHALESVEQEIGEMRRLFEIAAQGRLTAAEIPAGIGKSALRLGLILASARQRLEREIGLGTFEASLGEMCHGPAFLAFAEFIFSRHREFHSVHNAVLTEYRHIHRIRGRARPIPDLIQDGDWSEMPYWIWTRDNPRRRRVFVRKIGDNWELTDREGITFRPTAESTSRKWGCWRDMEGLGVMLRPRALITTMYARLVLSDLFIHGIGGARYDELNDEIIRRFFGIEPPQYLTATATFRLPIDRPNVTIDDVRASARLVRDVRYCPESLIGHPLVAADAGLERELAALAAEKRQYVRAHTLRRAPHDVFADLDRINRAMHERLLPLEKHLREEHARLIEQHQQSQLLGSREFSFVLYPENYLVPRLLALAKVPA